jgi:phosphoribosylformylglycinamidine synthase
MISNPVIGVVSFPGSNGDHDALHAVSAGLGVEARPIDYRATDLPGIHAVILPGGFSYGDALRCGAIARFAPVMTAVRDFAATGGPVLGICNGFQILCEAHLLPGALLRNKSLKFHCFRTYIRIDNAATAWTSGLTEGEILELPVAHGEGAFYADPATIRQLEANGQVVARYCDADGTVSDVTNSNGSVGGIAAVSNDVGNVVGLMPHPERATDPLLGGVDGLRFLRGVLSIVPV